MRLDLQDFFRVVVLLVIIVRQDLYPGPLARLLGESGERSDKRTDQFGGEGFVD